MKYRSALIIILISFYSLFIMNCASYNTFSYKVGMRYLTDTRQNEMPLGEKREFYDKPPQVFTPNQSIRISLFCIRRSESLVDQDKQIHKVPLSMSYAILTVNFASKISNKPGGTIKKSDGMIKKNTVYLVDQKDNIYELTALAYGKGGFSDFNGYYFGFDFYPFVVFGVGSKNYQQKSVSYPELQFPSPYFTNLVFLIPRESSIKSLRLLNTELMIPKK